MIEVEPAQVILVRLALSAVLADDEAGYGLEHLRRPEDRTRFDLGRGDRTLARRVGHPDETLLGVRDVGEVGERVPRRHHDVRGDRQSQDRVDHDGVLPGDGDLLLDEAGEVRQPEGHLVGARRDARDLEQPRTIGHGPTPARQRRAGQLDADSGQRITGLSRHVSGDHGHRSGARRARNGPVGAPCRGRETHEKDDGQSCLERAHSTSPLDGRRRIIRAGRLPWISIGLPPRALIPCGASPMSPLRAS